jgi:hypothetical protein
MGKLRSFVEKAVRGAIVAYGILTGSYLPYAIVSAYGSARAYMARKKAEVRDNQLIHLLLPWVSPYGVPVGPVTSVLWNEGSAAMDLYKDK